MAKKGFLTRAMNAVSQWLDNEFPSQEVKDELAKQGWKTETHYVAAMGYYTMGPASYTTIYSPEGELAVPGNDVHKRYKEAVKAASEKCAQSTPSPKP